MKEHENCAGKWGLLIVYTFKNGKLSWCTYNEFGCDGLCGKLGDVVLLQQTLTNRI